MISQLNDLKDYLESLYSEDGPERCGFMTENGLVEVRNVCDTPTEGFIISPSDVMLYEGSAIATWHTHPNVSSNLTGEDYNMFRIWYRLHHIIIGKDGFRVFKYDNVKKAMLEVKYGTNT